MNTEASIVGICINQPKSLERFLSLGVRAEHFQDPDCRAVFADILRLDGLNRSFDLVTLADDLGPGLISKLVEFTEKAPIAQDCRYFAENLLQDSFAKQTEKTALEILSLAKDRTNSKDLKAKVISAVDALCVDGAESDYSALAMASRFTDMVEKVFESKQLGKPFGYSTGLKNLDYLIQGFRPGALYILGARTGVGKSELCCNFAYNVSSKGYPAAYFTFEMTGEEITSRVVSRLSRVSDTKILNASMNGEELDRVVASSRDFAKLPLFIVDDAKMSWDEIKLRIRTLVRRNSVRVVFLDYIQQLNCVGFRPSERVRELSHISGEAKALAKDLEIAIVCAAQLNRQSGESDDDPPLKKHLKESGSLEQDANVVMLLHRRSGGMDLIVDKNRHGKEGAIPLRVNFDFHTVEEGR